MKGFLEEKTSEKDDRTRKLGAGRKKLTDKDSTLLTDLKELMESTTKGDPMAPLFWTCKSTSQLAKDLISKGHSISPRKVSELLIEMNYTFQGDRKIAANKANPGKDLQFEHISSQVKFFHSQNQPVLYIETRKKSVIGEYKDNGFKWIPKEDSIKDLSDQKRKDVSYGIYEVARNEGWISVGIDHDTAQFAVESIKLWWLHMGAVQYTEVRRILVIADCGGDNSYRIRLWKTELQKLSNETNLIIRVSHIPSGTSKWNKIEHRMYCHITMNWRGSPLTSREVTVNLIGHPSIKQEIKISDNFNKKDFMKNSLTEEKDLQGLFIVPDKFHGEWNYTIFPASKSEKNTK